MSSSNLMRRALSEYHTIAIVGLSANTSRPSYRVAKYLLDHDYRVIPVNPKYDQVLEQECYPNLESIAYPIDIVNLFQRAQNVTPFVESAIDIGAKMLWMQLGIINQEAAQKATLAGLEVVMDKCLKIEHARLFSQQGHG